MQTVTLSVEEINAVMRAGHSALASWLTRQMEQPPTSKGSRTDDR